MAKYTEVTLTTEGVTRWQELTADPSTTKETVMYAYQVNHDMWVVRATRNKRADYWYIVDCNIILPSKPIDTEEEVV